MSSSQRLKGRKLLSTYSCWGCLKGSLLPAPQPAKKLASSLTSDLSPHVCISFSAFGLPDSDVTLMSYLSLQVTQLITPFVILCVAPIYRNPYVAQVTYSQVPP